MGNHCITLLIHSTYLLFCADEISISNSVSQASSMDYIMANAPIPPAIITGQRTTAVAVGHRNKGSVSGEYVFDAIVVYIFVLTICMLARGGFYCRLIRFG